jgi:hypothetical protein
LITGALLNVALWHLTSFTLLQKCRRNRINSGQTAPSGFTDSAAIDPTATSAKPLNALVTEPAVCYVRC